MCFVFTPQACRDFVDVAESHSRRWQKALQHEREQRHHLEETIEQLAKQHNSLERAWRENPTSYTGETLSVSQTSCVAEGQMGLFNGWCIDRLLELDFNLFSSTFIKNLHEKLQ